MSQSCENPRRNVFDVATVPKAARRVAQLGTDRVRRESSATSVAVGTKLVEELFSNIGFLHERSGHIGPSQHVVTYGRGVE